CGGRHRLQGLEPAARLGQATVGGHRPLISSMKGAFEPHSDFCNNAPNHPFTVSVSCSAGTLARRARGDLLNSPKLRVSFPVGKTIRPSELKRRTPNEVESGATSASISRAARMLALAHHVERLIETGELTGYSEAARDLGLTRARLTQVMSLLLLAPEVQGSLLMGGLLTSERGLRVAVRESEWELQRGTLNS
ncbi:MAG: hypothetical protein ACI9F9_002489, partial [Candidatus Paceibacteria bacterium]